MEGAFHRVNVLHRKDELQPTYFSSLAYKDVRIDEAVIEIPNRRMIKRNVEDGVRRQRLAQLRHVDAMRAISQDELVRVDEKRRLDGRILFQAFQDRVDGPDIKIKQRIFDNRLNNMNEILDAVLVDPLGGGRKLVQLTLHGFDVRLSRAVQIGKNTYKNHRYENRRDQDLVQKSHQAFHLARRAARLRAFVPLAASGRGRVIGLAWP